MINFKGVKPLQHRVVSLCCNTAGSLQMVSCCLHVQLPMCEQCGLDSVAFMTGTGLLCRPAMPRHAIIADKQPATACGEQGLHGCAHWYGW
jgi:hypothetical protein